MITNTVQLVLEEYSGLYIYDVSGTLHFESNIPCLVEYELTDELLSSFLGYTSVVDEKNDIFFTSAHSENYNDKKLKIIHESNVIAEVLFKQDIAYYI